MILGPKTLLFAYSDPLDIETCILSLLVLQVPDIPYWIRYSDKPSSTADDINPASRIIRKNIPSFPQF